jgi:hypothetical protein
VGRGPFYNKIRLDPLKPETYAHPTFYDFEFLLATVQLLAKPIIYQGMIFECQL